MCESDGDVASAVTAEERAEPEGKALNLPVDLHINPHLWSQVASEDIRHGGAAAPPHCPFR